MLKALRTTAVLLCCSTFLLAQAPPSPKKPAAKSPAGKVRNYFIAADEVEWDYAPLGMDHMTGKPFDKLASAFVDKAPNRIGHIYRKAVYREYTDATFQHLKPRPEAEQHMGILGPVIRAEVGDTIRITFKNNATQPYSMHPHGVSYKKDSEGSPYANMSMAATGLVPPGQTHIYTWEVPERAGPANGDESSALWLYHSHNYEPKDVNAGPVGPLIITRRGMARPDGSPKDVDREVFAFFMVFDEIRSHYIDHNINTYAGDPSTIKDRSEFLPFDANGDPNILLGSGFAAVNHKYAINGFLYGNNPPIRMKRGQHVRWYLMTMGDAFNFHTPHWHGNVVTVDHHNADIVALSPAQFVIADMTPDNPGTWMFHCHISEHMEAGMMTNYEVTE